MTSKSEIQKVPTKNDDGVEPIVTQVDILRLPVFLPDDILKTLDEDVEAVFEIGNRPAVKVKGKGLGRAEADVFHAIVHLGIEQGFEGNKVKFVTHDLLDFINWPDKGQSYHRLKRALKNLCDISIEIEIENRWKYLRLFKEADVWDRGGDQGVLFESTVEVGMPLIRLCERERLKQMHKYYFELDLSFLPKRMFELLSVLASDLSVWKIDLFSLRDRIPMKGVKYKSLSGIKQRLIPVLKRFESDGIIKSYEFERIPATRPKREMLIVQVNHDYFYSARYPRQLIADKQDREISKAAKELTRWKISEKTARALVEEKGEAVCRLQTEHLAYLKENGKSPDDAASFLIAAIRNDYELPEGFESQEERKRRQNITKLLRSAKRLFDDYQYNNARKAAEKVLELNPQSDAAKKIIDDINSKNTAKEENDRIECWIESCNCEVLETVHSETRQKIKSKMPLMANRCNEEGLKNPLYRSIFYETAKSAMMKGEGS